MIEIRSLLLTGNDRSSLLTTDIDSLFVAHNEKKEHELIRSAHREKLRC